MIVAGQSVLAWMYTQSDEFSNHDAQALGWHDGKRIVAGVAYTDYNGVNLCMHVVAAPGRRWLTREFLWRCFHYPFVQLGVARVTGLVGSGNMQGRRFDEHLGFTLETTLRGAHPTGDLLVYVLWRKDCRWLTLATLSAQGEQSGQEISTACA